MELLKTADAGNGKPGFSGAGDSLYDAAKALLFPLGKAGLLPVSLVRLYYLL